MRKVIFTLLVCVLTTFVNAQTTYYWVGGATGTWSSGSSWNTLLDGSGTSRTVALDTDFLIFDGTNIGGSTPATGTVTPVITGSFTIAQLRLVNNAAVILQRSGTTGTSSVAIFGDGDANTDDFLINAGCSLRLTATTSGMGLALNLGLASINFITGKVAGNVTVVDGGLASVRMVATNPNTLSFLAGSTCTSNITTASQYIFGSSTQGAVGGINFLAGSQFIFQGGTNPMANSTHNPFIMQKGSTVVLEAANPAGFFTNRVFGNVTVRNNAVVTMAENFYTIDTLRIEAGASFFHRITGTAPFTGDIINNGTFGAATGYTSAHLIMCGNVPQRITGTGTFTGSAALSVATDANVTLGNNYRIGAASGTPPTSTITGILNMGSFSLVETGNAVAGRFSLRSAQTASNTPGTLTNGSHVVTLNAAAYATANVVIGGLVTGAGIQPNSYIIATSSGNSQFTMSKPAIATTAADAAQITITANQPTLVLNNPNGVGGAIQVTGDRTFGSGANYVFNAATTTPFNDFMAGTGNLTLNAPITTNKTGLTVSGTLTVNNGKLTIRATDTIRILNGNEIAGGPFNNTKYIALDKSGSNSGVLRIDGINASRLLPIGSTNNYLPVTITPTETDSIYVSVFEGITTDGTANGTAMSPAEKSNVVDAVWKINRLGSTVTSNITALVGWPASLEGSNFTNFANTAIGIANHNTTWGTVFGTGDNVNNTATANFNTFGSFAVGGTLGSTLPVRIVNVNTTVKNSIVEIKWQVEKEINVQQYVVEASSNGRQFTTLATVIASNNTMYTTTDFTPAANTMFYRIKVINKDNSTNYSPIVKAQLNSSVKPEIAVYPNPVKGGSLNISLTNFEKGKADVLIFNSVGQLIANQSIFTDGGTMAKNIPLPSSTTKGIYTIIVHFGKQSLQQTLLID